MDSEKAMGVDLSILNIGTIDKREEALPDL